MWLVRHSTQLFDALVLSAVDYSLFCPTDLHSFSVTQICLIICKCVLYVGNPAPEVVWLHNGKEIQESEDFHFEKKGCQYTLFIQEVFPEDTGTYTCEVWNEAGDARTEASLTVQGTNCITKYCDLQMDTARAFYDNVIVKYGCESQSLRMEFSPGSSLKPSPLPPPWVNTLCSLVPSLVTPSQNSSG